MNFDSSRSKRPPRQVRGGRYTVVMSTGHKIVSGNELANIVRNLKKQGKKIVTTNGVFDILHIGHKRVLDASRALGDVLIVGVNSDSSVKQYKSDLRPVISENDRAEIISGFECVDYVTIFNEPDPKTFLDLVKPHVHTKSGDYKAEELIEYSLVKQNGGEVVIIPYVEGKSTTNIIEQITNIYGSKNSQKK